MTPLNAPRTQLSLSDLSFRRAVFIAIMVGVAYYLTAKIGFEFTLQPGSISTLWMPNSLLLAGLLLTPPRWWWMVILGALPAHLASELLSGVPTLMVMSWFVSNCVQALIGAYLTHLFIKDDIRFDRLKDLIVFLVCCAFLGPFLSSFLDSALVKLNGWGSVAYWDMWRLRFLSNVLATLTLVPFVVAWATGGLASIRRASRARYLEAALLLVTLFAVDYFVFNTPLNAIEQTPSRLYWPLPFLVWATIRFGLRGVSASLLIVMFLAIIGATRHTGPFVATSSANNAMAIQAFLIVVAVPLIVLAAVIEERRLTEAAARDNEERLTLALNAAQMETWDWQIADNKLIWSENMKRMLGFEPEDTEITLDSFYQIVHPDDKEALEAALESAMKNATPYEVEFRLILNASTRWFLSKGKVFYDATNEPVRMLGVGIDITDRKHSEQALTEINQRNQAILRAIPDAMFLQNKEGVYLDFHTRDFSTLLLTPSEFLGKKPSEVLPPDLSEKIYEVFARLDHTDEPQVLEYSVKINNEDRHYEARLVSAEGDKVLSMVRDVTNERQAAAAVREGEARLLQSARQVRGLAARLINAQESERRRIAILLHDDVSQNVAALGLAISSLKRKLPTSSDQIIQELNKLGKQVHDLTDQIRQLSHQLHPEILEQVGLVKALESHVAEFSEDEKISINFAAEVATSPIPQEVAVCLYRVALEAVRNVSKHSGAKSAKVAITEGYGFLELKVSDTGRGFDVDKAKHGSGLGLMSSEERVRQLQGTLEIYSDSHTGTSLVARVPLSRPI